MTKSAFGSSGGLQRRSAYVYLALSWLAGFLSGMLLSFKTYSASSVLFLSQRLSFLGLLVVLLFPLAISVLLVRHPKLFFLLAFLKACAFGFCCGCTLTVFRHSGWLLAFLFLFSDVCFEPWLYFFWHSHLVGDLFHQKRHIITCFLAALVIGTTDYFFVSPYLLNLINL